MMAINAGLKDRGGSDKITLFTAFAAVCPDEFFILFKHWLKLGSHRDNVSITLVELCELWR